MYYFYINEFQFTHFQFNSICYFNIRNNTSLYNGEGHQKCVFILLVGTYSRCGYKTFIWCNLEYYQYSFLTEWKYKINAVWNIIVIKKKYPNMRTYQFAHAPGVFSKPHFFLLQCIIKIHNLSALNILKRSTNYYCHLCLMFVHMGLISHARHGFSSRRQLDCCLSTFPVRHHRKYQKLHIIYHLQGNSPVTVGFP